MSDRVKGACLTMGGAACWGVSGCMGQYPTPMLQGWAFLMGGAMFALIFLPWSMHYVPTPMGIFGIFTVLVLLSLPAKQKTKYIMKYTRAGLTQTPVRVYYSIMCKTI